MHECSKPYSGRNACREAEKMYKRGAESEREGVEREAKAVGCRV